MFGTIRKHQTWLWSVIITLTIISFVIFFSPYSKLNAGRRAASNYGTIDGDRVSEQDFNEAKNEVLLLYFVRTGNFPDDESKKMGFDVLRETYYRLLLIHKQQELNIHVSPEAVARAAWSMVAPLQRYKINSPTAFIKQVLEPRGFAVDDFERFIRHELGIQDLVATVGLSGNLVTPQEAKGLYVREHEELETEAVFLSASNYLSTISITNDVISQFYSNRIANYRIPERIQVSYVEYPITNFAQVATNEMAKITNLNAQVDEIYQQRGTNYYREAKTPDEAKEKIRDEFRKKIMTVAAQTNAETFVTKLFDLKDPQPADFESVAKSNGLVVKATAPFDLKDGPKELNVSGNFAKKAFSLSTNEPFAGPLTGDDAVYVIGYNKYLPSEIPPLDQIRDRVTADYKFDQARTVARMTGQAFYNTLTNEVAKGATFSNICAQAKLQVVSLPPFSLSTRSLPEAEDQVSLDQLKQLAFSTSPGKVSPFQQTLDGGVIVYVKNKLPLDEAKMKTELPGFVNYVRQSRQNEAFQEWFRRQADRGLRDTPLGWPKPAPSMSSSGAKS